MTCHKYQTGKIGCSQIFTVQSNAISHCNLLFCVAKQTNNKKTQVEVIHRGPFNWFENAELKRLNYINTSWSHLCTKHSSHTGKGNRGRRGAFGARVVFLLWCVQGVVANQSAAQADVSNSFSIISSTSSGRYLWYFSGFLVNEMFAHLEGEKKRVWRRSKTCVHDKACKRKPK